MLSTYVHSALFHFDSKSTKIYLLLALHKYLWLFVWDVSTFQQQLAKLRKMLLLNSHFVYTINSQLKFEKVNTKQTINNQ